MPRRDGGDDGRLFAGVRFALVGFDPVSESQYRSEIVRRGGADAGGLHGVGCTHVIVCGLVYDDPVCVAARKEGKKVVSELWVDDSLDLGEIADADRVLYRPVRDLNGIPGSDLLCICLTGYQKKEREDIMKMVTLIGAQFSKSLQAYKITHLICYKFEGEKYDLAKVVKINCVNHRWLEDCLMAWEILPVDNYTKSGWELEIMEAEAKDSEDEEDAGRSSSYSRRISRSTPVPATEIRIGTHVNPDVHAPIRGPTISGNAEIAAGGHLGTPEQIRKAGYSSERAQAIKADIQSTPNTTGAKISTNPDAHASGIPSGKVDAPADQVCRDEANDNVERVTDISPGALCTPNTSGVTVSADCHVHQSIKVPAIPVDNAESIVRNCLDNTNQNNVNKALYPLPNGNYSGKAVHSSQMSGKVGLKDDGSEADLNTSLRQSNVEANLRSASKTASKNTPILSYSRKRSRKLVSPEVNSKLIDQAASPQNFEGITPRVGFNISPSRKSDHKISDLTDAESARDIKVAKQVDRSGSALAQRINVLSSISAKPSDGRSNSATGTSSSPFSSRESASEAPIISDPGKNSAQSVNLMEKKKSASFKSNLLSYRRTSLKLVRPAEEEKFPENSTKGNNTGSLKGKTLVLHEAMVEKRCAISSSVNSEGDKGNSGFSLQNKNADMSDLPRVNKNEVVAPSTESENVVSHQNLEADPKEITVTTTPGEYETFPKKISTSKVKKTSSKRFRNEEGTSSVTKKEAVSSKATHNKIVSRENVEAQPEKNRAALNAVECRVLFPEEISNIRANNANAKISQDTNSEANSALVFSKTKSAVENMENDSQSLSGSASADKHQRSSSEKVPNAHIKIPDAPIVDKTESMPSNSSLKERVPPENAESHLKRLSSNTSAADCETCTPNNVPNKRMRKAVAKRKVSAVQQHRFGSESCKNGSTSVSKTKVISSKTVSESSRNASKVAVDRDLQNANDDGAKDDCGSFCKAALEDTSMILQNSKASSKRQKTAADGFTDHNKENRAANSNAISKSKSGNICAIPRCMTKALENGKNVTGEHGMVSENDCGTLAVLEPRLFILSGHRLLRKEFKSVLKRLKGRVCRDSHHWSFQATHFIIPDLRRTEKLFAAAAAGRWILKPDYLTACNESGKFLEEEPFEWHGHGLSSGDTISLDAPRKWRQLRHHTGHGAFYGMQIIIYGECISPSLDTLKRAVRAGDGTILATSPPYSRFLKLGVDFAVVSAGMPGTDAWVQEFKSHNIPCISADYLVEFVCKPGHPLSKHILFNMHDLADKSHEKLLKGQQDVLGAGTGEAAEGGDADPSCSACGSSDREELMLVCGSEANGSGCGVGMHMDCCKPPLEAAPDGDWLCANCHQRKSPKKAKKAAKSRALKFRVCT